MGCSLLNGHLSKMLHVIEDPKCECGFPIESLRHYFLECPRYTGPKTKLLDAINLVSDCNINIILFGNKNLKYAENIIIFQSVHEYLRET